MAEQTGLHERTAAAGAVFAEESGYSIPVHFGDPLSEYNHAREEAVIVDHSARGKVEVQGTDSARFLHNLTTNDILGLVPGAGCEAFLTTIKARVIAYALIYRQAVDPPAFWLDLAPGTAGRIIEYLDRYLISEQVEFANHTDAFAQIHLAGPRAAALLGQIVGAIALFAEPLRCTMQPSDAGTLQFRRHDALGVPGYDLVCPAEAAASLWTRLAQAGARPAGREACEILRIEAGLPREGADIDENTFAPEVGRIAQTICYTKGCYLGQESIVMARDRGQVNRRLVGVKLASGPVPRDTPLFAQDKQAGRVTSSVYSPRLATTIGLAYVRRAYQEPGTRLEAEREDTRSPAEVASLPF
jgi:folate-binding protein YgfZ